MAAKTGNTYSSKNNRLLTDTLKRVCIQSPDKIRQACEAIVDKAVEGDINAMAFVFDRLEGKAVARNELSGPDGTSIPVSINVHFG